MPLLTRDAAGFHVIAATPFAEDGALDLPGIDRLTDFYLGCGVDGMTVLGVMGEAPKLTPEESRAAAARFIARAGISVIVGVSAPSVAQIVDLARFSMDKGASGVMVAPQPGLKTETAAFAHMAQVLEALGPEIPVCFQDYPQLTAVHVTAATILRLSREFPQVVMLKHEDCPGLNKLTAVREGEAAGGGPRLSILCGNGGLHLPQELARGADGGMTGFAFPEVLVEVVRRHRAGDPSGAEDLFDVWLPLIRHEVQPGLGLALRKEVLHRRGALPSPTVRAPGPRLTAADRAELDALIARAERRAAG